MPGFPHMATPPMGPQGGLWFQGPHCGPAWLRGQHGHCGLGGRCTLASPLRGVPEESLGQRTDNDLILFPLALVWSIS